ncbi:MAG: M23 family metallopeptidase [Deltaproteobacteria bacterium]|nr:M23 family metallopeptidase [Deltaproteobacteria bacterium]
MEAFKPVFDCRKVSPGDKYQLVTDDEYNLVNMTFETSPVSIYRLCQEGQKLVASKEEIILDKKMVKISGMIESSLFGALTDAGEQDQLAINFAEFFAWDIDFNRDLRKGDQFKIIFEKYYKDDNFIRYGKVLAAEYCNRRNIYQAIYFKDPEGREDYYNPEGNSLRRSFLRSPLRFTRISSGYSYRRLHPILKRYKPHLGIDLAAPAGTPVWAVADGVVTRKGWKNGNGNMVSIRHPNGYETMYNHLSRYGKDIKTGARVKQKDIIGYVGTTGLSTGPHLDYRLKKNGKFINPLKEKFPPGFPVNKTYRKSFLEVSQQMMALLDEKDSPSQKMVASLQSIK